MSDSSSVPQELASPAPAAEARPVCAQVMEQLLQKEPGIRGASLDVGAGKLRLTYDPKRMSLNEARRLSHRLGVELQEPFRHCTLRTRGMHCADCAAQIARPLERQPGMARVAVNPVAQIITVDYDTTTTDLPAVELALARAGYEAEPAPGTKAAYQASEARDRRLRVRMAVLTAVCLVALIAAWIGEAAGVISEQTALGLYVIAFLAGAYYSTARVIHELASAEITVDFLMIAAAIGAASIGRWPEGAVLLFLFSLSNTLEQYVLGRTRRAIESLMDLTPEEAVVRRDGAEVRVPVEELRVGDTVIVRPAERIPADGSVLRGQTSVDQSPMTGESIPIEKGPGDPLFAGTLNHQGAIEMDVTKVAGDTTLARMIRLVEEAQTERAQSQRFTEWFGQRYTLAVLALSAVTLLVPLLLLREPFAPSFYRAMTVLVVASPCAVVISIPAAILSAITSAARGGVLFKGGAHLEKAATIRCIAFDKTGTLTIGRPQVVDVRPHAPFTHEDVLRIAASVESLSEHPLARAVVQAAEAENLTLEPASDGEALVGRGVRATVDHRSVFIGKSELFTDLGYEMPPALLEAAEELRSEGNTVIFVGSNEGAIGLLAIADALRPSAAEAVRGLRELGIEHLVMLTGDNHVVAEAMAGRLGLEFQAQLLPEEKLEAIQDLRERYGSVAMMGDGINDAPSLAAADLGISLAATGTDVALETADVVLMADDLRHLPYAVDLARHTGVIIRQNLVFAFSVMGLLLLITYVGHLRLPYAVAGHEGSTVLVILNGLRLLAFPRPASAAHSPD